MKDTRKDIEKRFLFDGKLKEDALPFKKHKNLYKRTIRRLINYSIQHGHWTRKNSWQNHYCNNYCSLGAELAEELGLLKIFKI